MAARTGTRHPEGWQIGSVAGVPVVLARSWFLIAAVITFVFAPTAARFAPGLPTVATYVVSFGVALLLFGSVLVHELAHAVAARAVGMPASRIVINLWGGHTQFETEATTPGRSFVVAVVGPLSNAALAVPAGLGAAASGERGLTFALLMFLAVTNAIVAAFNLVPGLPLDGGRVLEAAVWRATGNRHTGTVVAGWGGRVTAVLVVGYALVWPLLTGSGVRLVTVVWAALVGGLLWSGAGAAIRQGGIRRRAGTTSVADLARGVAVVPVTESIAGAMRAAGAASPADLDRRPVLLVPPDDGVVGLLDPAAVSAVDPARWEQVQARSAAAVLPRGADVPVGLSGEELLRCLSGLPGDTWVVRDPAGRPVGLLRGTDVLAAVAPGQRQRR